MTPKEKAKELVNKYLQIYDGRVPQAKKCALIAVDEIESALTEYGRTSDELQNMDSEWRYWGQVKIEIENL